MTNEWTEKLAEKDREIADLKTAVRELIQFTVDLEYAPYCMKVPDKIVELSIKTRELLEEK